MQDLKGHGIRAAVLTVVLILALGLAACGDDDGEDSDAQQGGSSEQLTTGTAAERLDALYEGKSFSNPPTSSPKPATGKKIWVIDLGLASPGGLAWAKGATDAGKELGWDVKVFDGKFTPTTYLDGIRQAIAAKADGIVLIAIDCAGVKAGLEQARAAKIAIAAVESADCSDLEPGSPSLFDSRVIYSTGSFVEFQQSLGRAQADWIAAHNDKAKIIHVTETESFVNRTLSAGFTDELGQVCPDCEIVDSIDFVIADLLGPGLREKLEQALIKNPDADTLAVPFDDIMVTSGGAAAVMASGRNEQIASIAGTGYAPTLDLIRADKGVDATYGLPLEWESWAAMDGLNRVFAGEELVNSGAGVGMVDKDHNLSPEGQPFTAPIDFRALYAKAWKGE